MFHKTVIMTAAIIVAFLGLEIGASWLSTGQFAVGSPAEARLGRPLSPVSVAGAGRRTVRRCAADVYNC